MVLEPSSSDQILVRETPARYAINKAVEAVEGMALHVALIEAKGELINVAVQVLVAGVVIDAMQAPLQDRPNALDAVRRHVVTRVLASTVNDRLVTILAKAGIARMLVSVDGRARLDALPDFGAQRLAMGAINRARHGAPAALPHAENDRLADRPAPSMQLLALVLVALFAANIRLIDFDDAAQLIKVVAARFAEPTEDEPSGFLGDANFLGELHR